MRRTDKGLNIASRDILVKRQQVLSANIPSALKKIKKVARVRDTTDSFKKCVDHPDSTKKESGKQVCMHFPIKEKGCGYEQREFLFILVSVKGEAIRPSKKCLLI